MAASSPFNILVFSKTAGYRHASIPTGIAAIAKTFEPTGLFNVTASEDAEAIFTTSSLSWFRVIILLHTSGNFLTDDQLSALRDYVHGGGGVFALHGAAAGMPSSDWYGKLIGAHFDMHPDPEPGSLLMSQPLHPIVSSHNPPETWMDEWYNFTSHPSSNANLQVLLRGDTTSFKGGKHGDDHPIAWCQEFEDGRSVYIGLGHFDEAWESVWFTKLVQRGILWAARCEENI